METFNWKEVQHAKYQVNILLMHGDADTFESKTISVDSNADLEQLLNFVNQINSLVNDLNNKTDYLFASQIDDFAEYLCSQIQSKFNVNATLLYSWVNTMLNQENNDMPQFAVPVAYQLIKFEDSKKYVMMSEKNKPYVKIDTSIHNHWLNNWYTSDIIV